MATRRQRLIELLDTEVRGQALERDKGCCQACGMFYEDNEVHHIFRRGIFSVRWELDNLITLCRIDCHSGWADPHRKECQAWVMVTWPERFKNIDAKRKESGRFWDTDLEDMLEELRCKS